MDNKKGWVNVIEAFLAIVFLVGAGLFIISINQSIDTSGRIFEMEKGAIRSVQLNDSLREEILNIQESSLPIDSDNGDFPEEVKKKLDRNTKGLICKYKVCLKDDVCSLGENIEKDIYSDSALITISPNNAYSPIQLKIFCWE